MQIVDAFKLHQAEVDFQASKNSPALGMFGLAWSGPRSLVGESLTPGTFCNWRGLSNLCVEAENADIEGHDIPPGA